MSVVLDDTVDLVKSTRDEAGRILAIRGDDGNSLRAAHTECLEALSGIKNLEQAESQGFNPVP
jgi:hypothetical protein